MSFRLPFQDRMSPKLGEAHHEVSAPHDVKQLLLAQDGGVMDPCSAKHINTGHSLSGAVVGLPECVVRGELFSPQM